MLEVHRKWHRRAWWVLGPTLLLLLTLAVLWRAHAP